MRDPLLSTVITAAVSDGRNPDPADADAAPANRAARRGRAGKQAKSGAVHTGSAGHARAAQGRRINPVRRTG
jgi:hypothetical protein